MKNTFELEIELGNEEMQSVDNIVFALEGVVARLRFGAEFGIIRDINGNQVGMFNTAPLNEFEDYN